MLFETTKAIEIDPERAGTYSDFATTLYDTGQIEEAMATHNLAINKDPESETVLINYVYHWIIAK